MAKTARAAIEDLLTCESCHAFYYVERADDGARTRLRCTSCGHSRDVLLSGAKSSKWTLIDPNGEVSTFGAWEDLVRATPVARITSVRATPAADAEPPSEEGRKSLSGSALLDITPTPIAPKLALIDSAPQLPVNVDGENGEKVEQVPLAKDEDIVNEALVESLDSLPGIAAAPVPAEVAPVVKKPDWDEDEAEVLSVRDIQVVPEQQSAAIPTPAAPPAGKLRTLPPARIDGPPPPTITFESPKKTDDDDAPEAKSAGATSETTMKTVTVVQQEPTDEKPAKAKVDEPAAKTSKDKDKAKDKGKKAEDKEPSRTRTTDRPAARSAAGGAEAVKAPKEEEGGRGWVLPAIGVAVAATVVWWIASSPPASTAPTTPESHAAADIVPESTAATATANPTPPATAETPTAVASATAAPTAAETTSPTPKAASADVVKEAPKPAVTTATANGAGATGEPKKKAVDATSLADALDKAGAAKRAGNLAAARELYGRVLRESPSNVEAHGGLGDVARAQGNLPAAKASYQQALASSPNYAPAMLGLADTLWDMGDRAGAQTQYAAIVRARGANAPERAVARSTGK